MSDAIDMQENFALAYIDSCDRLPLLLIHGFPLASTMWEFQIEDLGNLARIIAPDLRGHGRSDTVSGPYTVAGLAEDCIGLLDTLSIFRPAIICGLSMGGYIAFEIYRRFPERVAGLILTATWARPDTPEGQVGRDKGIALVEKEGVAPLVEGMLPKLFAQETAVSNPGLVADIRDIMLDTSPQGAIGALHAMKNRPDSTPLLATIDVPTLVIHGREDQIIPLSEAQAVHKAIPNAQLVVLENAGHLPNLEQPDLFNDAVLDFLELFEEEDEVAGP